MGLLGRTAGHIKRRVMHVVNRPNLCSLLRNLGFRFAQVRIGKIKLWVDLEDGLGQYVFIHRRYEAFETSLIEQIARPGMTVVDIGANIGYYTLILASRVGKMGKVYAIEPEPTNMMLLQRNIQLNRLSNVVCEQTAVLDYEGQVTLYLSDINHGDHRVFDAADDDRFNAGTPRNQISVRTIVLDRYLANVGAQVDLVKMDIQGAEMLALDGMVNTLSNPNLVLFCEFWPYALRQTHNEPSKFLESLKQLGFEIFEIIEANQTVIPVNPVELANRFADPDYADLICVQRARVNNIPFLSAAPGNAPAT